MYTRIGGHLLQQETSLLFADKWASFYVYFANLWIYMYMCSDVEEPDDTNNLTNSVSPPCELMIITLIDSYIMICAWL